MTNDGLSQNITRGNENIRARQAQNIDLSLEYYFDDGDGLLSIGIFQKDIDNEQFEQTVTTPNPADPLGEARFRVTTFSDNGSAELFGFEITAIKSDFSSIHPSLAGLQLTLNYTYIDAELNAILNDGTARVIGGLRNQPEQLFNLVASYETGPFGASVAYNWQGDAFTGVFETNPGNAEFPSLNDRFLDSIGRLDASIWYNINDNLQINFAAQNLTDEIATERAGLQRDLLRRGTVSEGSYWLGVKFKY